jgi:hypothetical protein
MLVELGESEVSLEIVGPAGPAYFGCKVKGRTAAEKDYSVLKPEDRVRGKSGLLCFEGLDTPGRYTAQARYHDTNPRVPPAPPGTEHLAAELVSPAVEFEVVRK